MRAAAKAYDNLSMLRTCACCGGEHGKGSMFTSESITKIFCVHDIKVSWEEYKNTIASNLQTAAIDPGLDLAEDARMPPSFVRRTDPHYPTRSVKRDNGKTETVSRFVGMDNESGLLLDDEGREFKDTKYAGFFCRTCVSQLKYTEYGSDIQKERNANITRRNKRHVANTAIDNDGDDGDDGNNDDYVDESRDCEMPTPRSNAKSRIGVPKMAMATRWAGMVPDELLDLTRVEKSMISIHNCVTSFGLMDPRSRTNYALKKKTIFTIVQDVAQYVTLLPREPDISTTCVLSSATSDNEFTFRPKKVLDALDWLFKYNVLYQEWHAETDTDYGREDFVARYPPEDNSELETRESCDNLVRKLDQEEQEAVSLMILQCYLHFIFVVIILISKSRSLMCLEW
jgi:hypothetical protein